MLFSLFLRLRFKFVLRFGSSDSRDLSEFVLFRPVYCTLAMTVVISMTLELRSS